MKKNSYRQGADLVCGMWLVVNSDGEVRMTRGEPGTGRGEIAVSVEVRVPMALFRKPLIRATVQVPETAGMTDAEAIHALAEVVRASDFNVDLAVATPAETP